MPQTDDTTDVEFRHILMDEVWPRIGCPASLWSAPVAVQRSQGGGRDCLRHDRLSGRTRGPRPAWSGVSVWVAVLSALRTQGVL